MAWMAIIPRKALIKYTIISVGVYCLLQIFLTLHQFHSYVTKKESDSTRSDPNQNELRSYSSRVTNCKLLEKNNDTNVHKIGKFKDNVDRSQAGNQVIHYPNFYIEEPRFISNKSKTIFLKSKINDIIGYRENDTLRGEIVIMKNGTFDVSNDCGYKSDRQNLIPSMDRTNIDWFPMLMPMVVPGGNTFQHFLDGVLPKLMQSLHILQNPNVKILMRRPRDKILFEFFSALKISSDRLVFVSENTRRIGADTLIFTCNTPPIHPLLWQRGRAALGGSEVRRVPVEEAFIILVTRAGSYNGGRRILNEEDLIKLLHTRYGEDFVKVFKGPMDLKSTVDLYGRARLILGSHGGGMYNVNFAPMDTAVVEFMPVKKNGDMMAASATMIWIQALMLQQTYWRVCVEAHHPNGDMNVDLQELEQLLQAIDASAKSSTSSSY